MSNSDTTTHISRATLLTARAEQDAHTHTRLAARADEVIAWVDRMYIDPDDQVSATDIVRIDHAYPAHHTLALDLAQTRDNVDADLRQIIALVHAARFTHIDHPGVTAAAMRDPYEYVATYAEVLGIVID